MQARIIEAARLQISTPILRCSLLKSPALLEIPRLRAAAEAKMRKFAEHSGCNRPNEEKIKGL